MWREKTTCDPDLGLVGTLLEDVAPAMAVGAGLPKADSPPQAATSSDTPIIRLPRTSSCGWRDFDLM
jgi:hypothetical protein